MKIQPGHDVLSLFGISGNSPALTIRSKNDASKGLIVSLVGAFLIVIMFGFASSIITKNLNNSSSVSATNILSVDAVPTAYQPGQFVSQKIGQGYLGSYR